MHTKIYIKPILTNIQVLESNILSIFETFAVNFKWWLLHFPTIHFYIITYQDEELSKFYFVRKFYENILRSFILILFWNEGVGANHIKKSIIS